MDDPGAPSTGPARLMRFEFMGHSAVEAWGGRVIAGDRQPALMLARLVLDRPNPLRREELADLLWPRGRPARWEGPARHVVSRARALLTAVGAPATSITSRAGQLEIDVPADIEVDVETALGATAAAERRVAAHDWKRAGELAAEALDGLRLPFFPASEAVWTRRRQDRLRAQLLRTLHISATVALNTGAPGRALERAEEALDVDPSDEVAALARTSARDMLAGAPRVSRR